MARAGLTVERLTTAAAELADEVGFDKVTISALARTFGVKDASLYSHLRNLRELRELVAERSLGELANQVAAAVAGRAGKDALLAFANAYRDYARAHPGRYAATQLDLDPVSPAADAARRHAELTRALLRGYDLAEPAQTDAVRLLGATFHGYVSLESAGLFDHHPRPPTESWSAALDALDTALRNWPEGGAERSDQVRA